jgi:hypothetical protein
MQRCIRGAEVKKAFKIIDIIILVLCYIKTI